MLAKLLIADLARMKILLAEVCLKVGNGFGLNF